MAQKNDAELASVMRKLVPAGQFVATTVYPSSEFTFDDTTIEVTTEERMVLEELMDS